MGFATDADRSDDLDTGYASAVISVSTAQVEAKVGASRLTYRQAVLLFNDGISNVFFGPSGVAVSGTNKGVTIVPAQAMFLSIGGQALYLISASTGTNVVVQELA